MNFKKNFPNKIKEVNRQKVKNQIKKIERKRKIY